MKGRTLGAFFNCVQNATTKKLETVTATETLAVAVASLHIPWAGFHFLGYLFEMKQSPLHMLLLSPAVLTSLRRPGAPGANKKG